MTGHTETLESHDGADTGLVDIRDVSVDAALPKEERIAEFVRQIKNPYRFRCGAFKVTAKFNKDGPTLEDCLSRLMAH